VGEVIAAVDVDVRITPEPSVIINVASVAARVALGSALAFTRTVFRRSGAYVLTARSEDTIPPALAGMDVLNAYDGVANVGVGRRAFGSVVATVADAAEK
jgi:hypothetical protein